MNDRPEIDSTVETAIAAIKQAAQLLGERNSGIDDAQIKQLRAAIDELETVLNGKKRDLIAART